MFLLLFYNNKNFEDTLTEGSFYFLNLAYLSLKILQRSSCFSWSAKHNRNGFQSVMWSCM